MCNTIKRLPQRLEELRKVKGCTKRQLAAQLGISETLYSRVISGQRSLSDSNIEALADIFGIDCTELQALSLADKVNEETSLYRSEVVDKALKIVTQQQ